MGENDALANDIEEQLRNHLAKEFHDDWTVRGLSQHFRREGYVKVSGIVPPDLKRAIGDDARRLLDQAKRIDTTLKETSNTPRRMSTVGFRHIADNSELVPAVYESPALLEFLSRLAGERVLPCPYEPERFVMTKQEKVGDTHGWHWGDFSFALIWIVEAPEIEAGGMLQCVPHTDWNKSDPRVHDYLVKYPVKTYYHSSGDIYFLRTDTTLHRTVPLNRDATRIILNTAWANAADLESADSHETMDALFD
ncbi:ArpA protein [Streptomyces sp. NBC_00669]|uniref:HalD/BesD family halogenase n=1 Tax=unclassified Streptomyces TaxID=2593676 RepID=UPI002E2EB324|nr:ArpA protein [Streptomyces sp. NBC_00669]